MIVIYNSFIPFKGFSALTLWPFIFVRKGANVNTVTVQHEMIHARQQMEMLIIFFLLWYVIEWLIRWAYYRDRITAYRNISFEREAYAHQAFPHYPDHRKPFAWMDYLWEQRPS